MSYLPRNLGTLTVGVPGTLDVRAVGGNGRAATDVAM
jgi:hypothetical protein